MEPTNSQPIPSTTAPPASSAAGEPGMASPAPAAPPPPAMPPSTAPVQTAQAGHFFSGIDWTDVVMIGITLFTLGLSVYASRQQLLFVRAGKKTILQDIDEIKSNLQTVMGDQYQPYST